MPSFVQRQPDGMMSREKKVVVRMKLKRKYYETAIAVMDVLSSKLWVKEKCRIVIDYDPAEEMVTVNVEPAESPCSPKESETSL